MEKDNVIRNLKIDIDKKYDIIRGKNKDLDASQASMADLLTFIDGFMPEEEDEKPEEPTDDGKAQEVRMSEDTGTSSTHDAAGEGNADEPLS